MDQITLSAADINAGSRWAFIVGAPRCGTTSLSRYLRGHPDVCFSSIKEPHFFSRHDLRGLPADQLRALVRREYVDRFYPHRDNVRLMAEGSVTYFYVPEQLEPILKLWPKAKFIVGVRNPLQMIPSLHQRNVFNGDETERHFERAWSLVPRRRQGSDLPRRCADPRWLDYWEIGRIGKYLDNFLRTVGRERCFISVYDDFATDPAGVYNRILDFLGLPKQNGTDFRRYRESTGCRVMWLQRLLKRPPRAAVSLVGTAGIQAHFGQPSRRSSAVAETTMALRKKLLRWNRVPHNRPPLDPKVLREMSSMYSSDIAQLSDLLGRDLSHWLEV